MVDYSVRVPFSIWPHIDNYPPLVFFWNKEEVIFIFATSGINTIRPKTLDNLIAIR